MQIFCSGIGGIGLSAYAALQHKNGHTVSGSDRVLGSVTDDLMAMGISVSDRQDGSAVPENCELFVYSEAIPFDAPERVRARERGVRELSYFAALGELSRGMKVIAVCGTHGKSTTTAMTAVVLTDAGLDPTVVVGTRVPQLQGKNWRKGASDLFVVEACEYKGSFLHLDPSIIIVTNIDWDHVDAYPTEESYREAYAEFFNMLPADGILVLHGNDSVSMSVSGNTATVNADECIAPKLSVPGAHMRENAKLVLALCSRLGLDEDGVRASLAAFAGTWRRMEIKGDTRDGVTVVDDYAHHPAEIRASIAAMREKFPDRRMVCVFQPHMHDRTIALFADFVGAFGGCDAVLLTDVYEARTEATGAKADIAGLAAAIGAKHTGSLTATEDVLRSGMLRSGDVLLVMGAGDVTGLAARMLQ